MSNKYTSPNDASFHRIEELRHQRHTEIREQARAGDGTIEAEENQRAAMLAAKYRNERDAARAELAEIRRQLAEVTK
jgi:hypothetical protein